MDSEDGVVDGDEEFSGLEIEIIGARKGNSGMLAGGTGSLGSFLGSGWGINCGDVVGRRVSGRRCHRRRANLRLCRQGSTGLEKIRNVCSKGAPAAVVVIEIGEMIHKRE